MVKLALLIGVSEYEPGLNPLPAAVKDMTAMQQVLQHPAIGGFTEQDVRTLKNPDRQTMEEEIESLFAGRQKDDLVLLFFSGHGIKDDTGRLYLATGKTRKTPQGELIRSTAVSASFVHESMSLSRSKRQIVVLDSCFSGAFAEGLSAKDDGTVNIRQQLGGEGRAVLTSSTSTQYSFELKGSDLSLYTRYLIEGMQTGAADLDEDGAVSVDELHDYASTKVREIKPEMKPEMYAIREGFKIRLTKVPPIDPWQRYRKEVARYSNRGEISFVGRRTLDVLRTRLGLEVVEAKSIEDEILEPYRQEFRQKLQQYEQVFTEVVQRDEAIGESDRNDLRNFQQVLGLRSEDTIPIEVRVTAQFKAYKQKLQEYEQAFSEAIRQEYPLSEAMVGQLRQLQQSLELAAKDITSIETRITTEVEAYRRKLQQYQQAFVTAIQQEYPLTVAKYNELRQQQQSLGLMDVDIAPIEAQITTQIRTYQEKLSQYEQAFASATHRKHYPSEATYHQLRQSWQALELKAEDVAAIEARITVQIDTFQDKLSQYEQAFTKATKQQYPLSETKQQDLRLLQQLLQLTDEDVTPIEAQIKHQIEQHLQKLQQYEQVLAEYIRYEYPVSDETCQELCRFQQILELGNEDVSQIEQQVVAQYQGTSAADEASELNVNFSSSKQQQLVQEQTAQSVQLKKSVDVTPTQVDLPTPTSLDISRNQLQTPIQIFEKIGSSISNRSRLGVGVSIAVASLFFISIATYVFQNSPSTVTSTSPAVNEQIERDRAILAEAKSLAIQKDLKAAIQKAKEIKANSSIYEQARKHALTWQATVLQNYLQFEYPKRSQELNYLGELKPEVLVDIDRVTVKFIYGNSNLKESEDTLRKLTLLYMQAIMGYPKESIPPKYTDFSLLIVYCKQDKQKAALTSNYWQDYLEKRINLERLLNQIQITNQ